VVELSGGEVVKWLSLPTKTTKYTNCYLGINCASYTTHHSTTSPLHEILLEKPSGLAVGVGACAGAWYMGSSSMTKLFRWTVAVGQIQEYTGGSQSKGWSTPRVAFNYQGKDASLQARFKKP